MPKKVFALIDCNNFFVSCERAFRPDLTNKPVAVLSSNDGCFVSRSNEVKKLGIPMGAPYFQYKDIVEKNKIQLFSGNFSLYRDLSSRVMQTIAHCADEIEVYSIDEAFIELRAGATAVELMRELRKKILQWTRIPVSIGIGETKVLAKLSSHIAKITPQCDGVFDCSNKNIDDLLACLSVRELWGVGRKHEEFLVKNKIETVLDFKNCDDGWIRTHLTVHGLELLHEVRGKVCFPLHHNPGPAKSLVYSRSFGHSVQTLHELERVLVDYTTQAAEKLREQGQITGQLTVFARTKRYSTENVFQANAVIPLLTSTAFTPTLIKAALHGLHTIFKPGFHYAKAGVCFTLLQPEGSTQQNLFEIVDTKKEGRLMRAIDSINFRYGSRTLDTAIGIGEKKWKVKREHSSPRYTTVLSEIPLVR